MNSIMKKGLDTLKMCDDGYDSHKAPKAEKDETSKNWKVKKGENKGDDNISTYKYPPRQK